MLLIKKSFMKKRNIGVETEKLPVVGYDDAVLAISGNYQRYSVLEWK